MPESGPGNLNMGENVTSSVAMDWNPRSGVSS